MSGLRYGGSSSSGGVRSLTVTDIVVASQSSTTVQISGLSDSSLIVSCTLRVTAGASIFLRVQLWEGDPSAGGVQAGYLIGTTLGWYTTLHGPAGPNPAGGEHEHAARPVYSPWIVVQNQDLQEVTVALDIRYLA